MMQEFVKSQKLEKWLKWMQTIQDEIIPLLSDVKVFWEVQDIIRQNPHIKNPVISIAILSVPIFLMLWWGYVGKL